MDLRFVSLVVLVLATGAFSLKSKQYKDDDGIYHLTFDDADQVLEHSYKYVAVFFHAPWKEHSDGFLHEFRLAWDALKTEDDLAFAVVDVSDQDQLAMRFGIMEPPEYRVFREGNPHQLYGNRTRFGVIEGVKKHLSPDWEPEVKEENVIELTDTSFEEITKKERLVMVQFYAPWCNHCKQLEATYEMAAKELKKLDPPVKLARIDAAKYRTLADSLDVKGYPTLYYYRNGKKNDYQGMRSAEAIFHYLRARNVAPSKAMEANNVDLKIFLEELNEDCIVGFFPDRDAYEYQAFDEVADEMHTSLKFRHIFGGMEIAKKHYGVQSDDYAVVIFRNKRFISKYDKPFVVYQEETLLKDDLSKWVRSSINPLVGQFFEQSVRGRYGKRPMVTILYDIDWDREARDVTRYTWNKIVNVAKDFQDNKNLTFAIGDQEELSSLADFLGLGDLNEDVMVAVWGENNTRYPMLEEFSEDALREHVSEFLAGNLKPYFKSQRPPKKNNGPVKVVVASTFDKMVRNDLTKDILIYFYQPWNSACKKFDKVYQKAAKKLAETEGLLIAKFDIVNNDPPPNFTVGEMPFVVLLKKGDDRTPVTYSGNANSKEIGRFVAEHAVSLQKDEDEAPSAKDEL